MDIITQVTAKQLDFIDDANLRLALHQRLNELDRVFLVNAHYSTVFMAIGTIEGIFKHIAARYKPEIMASTSYPEDSKGKRKKFEKLTIDDLYVQLRDLDIMPAMDEYPALFKRFREYRNCMHPQAQAKEGWEINIGQAQMALGLLNATVRDLDRNVFVGKYVLEKIAGSPHYDSKSVLHLRVDDFDSRHHSFILLKEPITRAFSVRFDLDLSPESLLNFVFDYADDGDFRMLRLDRRPHPGCINGVLRSTQKFRWNWVLRATPQKLPPGQELFHVEIVIDFDSKAFDLVVDGVAYEFQDLTGKPTDLFSQVHKDKRVGFFNEVEAVKLSNIVIERLA
jgi:hypothetical protein